jgi:hypothetical protein
MQRPRRKHRLACKMPQSSWLHSLSVKLKMHRAPRALLQPLYFWCFVNKLYFVSIECHLFAIVSFESLASQGLGKN